MRDDFSRKEKKTGQEVIRGTLNPGSSVKKYTLMDNLELTLSLSSKWKIVSNGLKL